MESLFRQSSHRRPRLLLLFLEALQRWKQFARRFSVHRLPGPAFSFVQRNFILRRSKPPRRQDSEPMQTELTFIRAFRRVPTVLTSQAFRPMDTSPIYALATIVSMTLELLSANSRLRQLT